MVNIVSDTWQGQTFGKVDSLSISANCKLRRIFTMKHQPPDTTDDDGKSLSTCWYVCIGLVYLLGTCRVNAVSQLVYAFLWHAVCKLIAL